MQLVVFQSFVLITAYRQRAQLHNDANQGPDSATILNSHIESVFHILGNQILCFFHGFTTMDLYNKEFDCLNPKFG